MFEFPQVLVFGLICVVALALYWFFWRAVRDLSLGMKIAARAILTVVLILPLALVFFTYADQGFDKEAAAPPPMRDGTVASREDHAKRRERKAPSRSSDTGMPAPEPGAARAPQKKNGGSAPAAAKPKAATKRTLEIEARKRAADQADKMLRRGTEGAARIAAEEAAPPTSTMDMEMADAAPDTGAPPPAPNGGHDDAAPSIAATEAPMAQPDVSPAGGASPGAVAEPPKEDWTVVPVYYGTDREQVSGPQKISYSWKRGRRLELGRALVTIPKVHVVPMVERPWAVRIPYFDITIYEEDEDPAKHFTLQELKALTREEFLDLVRAKMQKANRYKDHALVFVHGYKNRFDNAVFRTAQIAYDLKFDSAPFLYSWPSGGTLQGYTYDRESAAQAEPYLRDFLNVVINDTGAKKISVIAHSMGNQLLLRVLQDLKRSKPDEVIISQLILAAPDVDRDSFENIVRSIRGIAQGVTLYTAANDTALRISRSINGGVARAGDVPEDGPIIVDGIDTIDATATSMDSVGINHSGYAENNALLTDVGLLIRTGKRPPDLRVPTLERVTTQKGAYWRYPAPTP